MADNIERRGNTWYAVLHIPADVRHKFDKFKFHESLKTTDRRIAVERARALVGKWKAQIAEARGQSDPFIEEALAWKRQLSKAEMADRPEDASEHEVLSLALSDHAERLAEQHGASRAGLFVRIATSSDALLSEFFEEWAAQLHQAPKTIDQMKKDVRQMIGHFVTVKRVQRSEVVEWVRELLIDAPGRPALSHSSLDRMFKFCRSFWKYLQEIEQADPERQPFVLPSFAKPKKRSKKADGWIPFAPAEVVNLLDAAVAAQDHQLADLIRLGMYTGARIEELCSLKAEDCTTEVLMINESKTDAGIRAVPVHSQLVETVERLKAASTDDYLLSGLTFNKYGDRSNAVGKRFGRLKTALGFPEKKVFHSIRKTVVTMMENAGISENLAADIVGHDKPRMTYGLYSGGHGMDPRKDAIEKVRYPSSGPTTTA